MTSVKVDTTRKVGEAAMNLVTVDSSMVHAVGYDEEAQELEVVFNSGKIWRYVDVPKEVYEELLKASSVGSYMHGNILGFYGETPVRRAGRRR